MPDIWTSQAPGGHVTVIYLDEPMVMSAPKEVIAKMQRHLEAVGYTGHELVGLERGRALELTCTPFRWTATARRVK